MEQFIEFVGNHWLLSGLWVALLGAFLLHRARSGAQAVGLQQAVFLINRKDALVLDIRDKKEFDAGHIVDAVHIPYSRLSSRLTEIEKHKSRPVVVVCKMGQHSGDACKTLENAGFEQVVRLKGGLAAWRAEQLPVVTS